MSDDEYGTPETEDAQHLGYTKSALTWPEVVQNLGFLVILIGTGFGLILLGIHLWP